MSRYQIESDDGSTILVDTRNARISYPEATRWDGSNHISRATGSQWEHETLYLSAKGRWYIERTSQWQGSTPGARFVSEQDAAAWLLANNHDLPAELSAAGDEVSE